MTFKKSVLSTLLLIVLSNQALNILYLSPPQDAPSTASITPEQEPDSTPSPSVVVTLTASNIPFDSILSPITSFPEPSSTATPPALPLPSTSPDSESKAPPLSGYYAEDEVLVEFDEDASQDDVQRCLEMTHAVEAAEINKIHLTLLKITQGSVSDAAAILLTCPGVLHVEPNYITQLTDTFPNDAEWGNQYGLVNIRAPGGWEISTGSSFVTIAILDTGIEYSHPDLAGKVVAGYDFVNNDAIANDDNGHGTHVAGIAAATSNNSVGIAGVSWGARVMPVKVLNAAGRGTYASVAQGIVWATDQGAQIINISLGGSSESSVLEAAVEYAYSKGVILVAAAGNTGSNFVLYPARYPQVVAVGATDSLNQHAGFSNYGPEIDLSAPGASIYSTQYGGYGYRNGTSMAAPFVSGLAAILRGIPGNNWQDAIIWQMKSTALDLGISGQDNLYGYGLIQMDAAIRTAWPSTATPVPTIGQEGSESLSPLDPSQNLSTPFLQILFPAQTPTHSLTTIQNALTPASQIASADPNMLIDPVPPGDDVTTPEVSALDQSLTSGAHIDQSCFLPVVGVLLILLGVWLFSVAMRRNRESFIISRFR